MQGQEYRNKINEIRNQMLSGAISYKEAQEKAQPIIDEMNEIGKKIATKYGKKHVNFTFSYLMR